MCPVKKPLGRAWGIATKQPPLQSQKIVPLCQNIFKCAHLDNAKQIELLVEESMKMDYIPACKFRNMS